MTNLCTQISENDNEWAGFHTKPRPVVAPQQPRVVPVNPADAFRNMFAILHNLDADELKGIASWGNAWPPDSLSRFILRLDDARLDALYALVQKQQPERYRGIV